MLALHSAENSFASGVRLGVNCVRPRVPAVFTAKTHWRNYDHITEQTELRENYITAQEHRDVVQKQFEKEASLGAMMEIGLEQAQKSGARFLLHLWGRWRKLTEATGLYMMQHTASLLIQRYGCRIKSEALQALPNAFFALKGDVSRAHRLVKVDKRDWKHLACRTGVHPDRIWLNKVGTFGVASAAYHWSRFMSGLGRAAYYLWGKLGILQLVYVDDLLWLVGEKGGIEHVVLVIFFYVLMGLPFSWKKFAGGLMCCWVGFENWSLRKECWACQVDAQSGCQNGCTELSKPGKCVWQICGRSWVDCHLLVVRCQTSGLSWDHCLRGFRQWASTSG